MRIALKRAYEPPDPQDGFRILVDRLWPRGVKRQDLKIDLWLKEIAPSTELRRWFGHDPRKWKEFRERYAAELARHPREVQELRDRADAECLTLVFAARDEAHNHALVLRDYLERNPD